MLHIGGHMAQVRGQSIVYVAKKQYLCIGIEKETRIILVRTTFAPRT